MTRTRRMCLTALVLAFAAPAAASAAVTVHTEPATSVARLSAQVNGTLTGDESGQWWFEWGTDPLHYGNTLGNEPFTPGDDQKLSLNLGGLDPGTEYHYRLVAQPSSSPLQFGDDVTFTTQPAATAEVTNAQVALVWLTGSTANASLSARVWGNGLALSWWVEYGTTPGLGLATPHASLRPVEAGHDVSIALSALQPGRTYFYRVVAQNDLGTDSSPIGSFATPALPPPAFYTVTFDPPAHGTLVGLPAQCSPLTVACSVQVTRNAVLQLRAVPTGGYEFVGWTGDCVHAGASPTCALLVSSNKRVSALFRARTHNLRLTVTGPGKVASADRSLACARSCVFDLREGASPVLRATAVGRADFVRWTGPCTRLTASTCRLEALYGDAAVTARFAAQRCRVPDVRGQTLRRASAGLRSSHCRLGTVTRAFSPRVKRGLVVAQRPAPGAKRPYGAKVGLVVSRGRSG